MPGRTTRFRPGGGGTGGGGTTGRLRWGPQFGNDEHITFGPIAAISVNEYRLGVQRDLAVQADIQLLGTIIASYPLSVVGALSAFFTLTFLYNLFVTGAISAPSIQIAGAMLVETILAHSIAADYPIFVTATMNIFFTLTFLYTTVVTGAVSISSIQIGGLLLAVQSDISALLTPGFTLIVNAAIRMTSLVLTGTTAVADSITMPALQVGYGNLGVVASITMFASPAADFLLSVSSAISMPSLSEIGTTTVNAILAGAYQISGLTMGVGAAITMFASPSANFLLSVAFAITMPSLSEVGTLVVNAVMSGAYFISPLLTAVNAIVTGSLAPGYTDQVAAAISLSSISIDGLMAVSEAVSLASLNALGLMGVNDSLLGALGLDYTALGVPAAISDPAIALDYIAAPVPTTVNVTTVLASSSSTDASSYSTASYTPNAGVVTLVRIYNARTGGATLPTLSGNGVTYDQVDTGTYGGNARDTVFRTIGPGSAGAITIAFGGVTQARCAWEILEVSNVNLGANGDNAIVQAVHLAGGAGTQPSVTLAAFSSTSNATIGFVSRAEGTTFTPGGGFTELNDFTVETTNTISSEWRDNPDTTVDFSSAATTNNWNCIAIELSNSASSIGLVPQTDVSISAIAEIGAMAASGAMHLTYVVDFVVAKTATFVVPNGVTVLDSEIWAAGGGGGTANVHGGGGGGGGSFARSENTVAAGDSLTIIIPAAGPVATNGNPASVARGVTTFCAGNGGLKGANGAAGAQGAGGAGGAFTAGDGGASGAAGGGGNATALNGGGGGGSAGSGGTPTAGNSNGTKGLGGTTPNGDGGTGGVTSTPATLGQYAGGGGGGASTLAAASAGGAGRVRLTMVAA